MTERRDLLQQFRAAHAKGWRVADDDFPASIADPFVPGPDKLFRALEIFSPEQVSYLILGQDPYPTQDANGIAFAVERDGAVGRLPSSLLHIMEQVFPKGKGHSSLAEWIAEKKILLLNAALTVPTPTNAQTPSHAAGGHLKLWRAFTISIVIQLRNANPNAKLVAWGAPARELICAALEKSGVFASCKHPSRPSESFTEFWETPVGASLKMRGK